MAATVQTAASVFGEGKLKVGSISIGPLHGSPPRPPKPLLITSPSEGGEYPVVLFFHGFEIKNTDYTVLFRHIASHGFVVVAPQLYVLPEDSEKEVKDAAEVANWLAHNLKSVLPVGVKPNLLKVALAGHSRGGHTAFSLALNPTQQILNFSALVGVDPVAGQSKSHQIKPEILDFKPGSFDLGGVPVMVIGSGLGDESIGFFIPPCAPEGVSHKEFYNECRPTCCHFVVEGYGHLDMLDDGAEKLESCFCKHGETREPMRRCVGGLTVAFLKAYFEGMKGDLLAIVGGADKIAPARLKPAVLRERVK
ncbi:hypothetical protein QJS04_geneDACA001996 [Acorus gramineus]|uniref:Chlorophyllase n=1 Tax=Acorus gramineus TaxID=55184 RepID=A0AAV9A9T7_ACOGR|nr:hypothetical protein QJS04_geneDACA001996 [Acorus gramineus]